MTVCLVNLLAILEFSSLPMLGWLAAAALPWLIHRWHRRQHRATSWAAVELLLSAMQQRARRVQMQQWLLLVLRTVILILVALAVAEPALRQWSIGGGNSTQSHRIIVLDQSFSMGCTATEGSRWQRAVEAARSLVNGNEGDIFTLIAWGRQTESVLGRPTADTSLMVAALDELAVTNTRAQLSSVILLINAAIDRAEAELPQVVNHQIILCTDLCPPTWEITDEEEQQLESLAQRANITLINVGEGSNSNLAIIDLQVDPEVTMRQQEVDILAKVACFGEPSTSEVGVELVIDGISIDQQQIRYSEDQENIVRFSHQFIDSGPKTLKVKLASNADCLAVDDQRWVVAQVRPRLRIACFAGTKGAVDDLARALSPNANGRTTGNSLAPEVHAVGRVGVLDLEEYDAVLLGSVSSLSEREVATLTSYVRQGGGFGMFVGSRLDGQTLARLEPLLPVKIFAEQPTGDYRFDPLDYRHAIVAPFRGQTQAGLLGVVIAQYQKMRTLPENKLADEVLVFDSGDPALVVDRFELGRVAVFALPGSLTARSESAIPWSTFPISPSFLPVVRELISHLVAGRTQQSNVLVGDTLAIPRPGSGTSTELRCPDGTQRSLSAHEDRVLFTDVADQLGVYHVIADQKEVGRFAANLEPRESNLRPVDVTTLPKVLENREIQLPLALAATGGEFSFTRSLLAAAAGLLLVEVGVASAMGRSWG